jgi:hypothetical protein
MGFHAASLLSILLLFQTVAGRQSQSGTVAGTLRTSTGVPLEGVRVAVEPVDNALGAEVLESIGLTDKAGRYVLENVSPGRYRILVGRLGSVLYHPGVSDLERATTVNASAGKLVEVPDMVFQRSRVSGQVVDLQTGRNRRIDSLTLCCVYDSIVSPSPLYRMLSLEALKGTVDENGAFLFSEVPAGDYYFQASGAGTVAIAQPITIGNSDVTGVEVKVTVGVEVRGRITDRLSEPVSSVAVALRPDPANPVFELGAGPIPGGTVVAAGGFSGINLDRTRFASMAGIRERLVAASKPRMVPTTSEGTFSFSRVPPGRYTLEMNAAGGNSFAQQVDVGAREALDVSLEVPFTRISGQIVVADGGSVPPLTGSVRFVPSDPDGRILFAFPDDAGRFSLLMAYGEYRLFTETLNVDRFIQSISAGSRDLQKERFVFEDGTRPQEIRITIAP